MFRLFRQGLCSFPLLCEIFIVVISSIIVLFLEFFLAFPNCCCVQTNCQNLPLAGLERSSLVNHVAQQSCCSTHSGCFPAHRANGIINPSPVRILTDNSAVIGMFYQEHKKANNHFNLSSLPAIFSRTQISSAQHN